ncbi:MAG: DUF2490 domain-containing protein [Crocinitomicaceae bacterium]|nr:DUF2490 domain-containing protein [Crocinitomicaceae bacterium]
MRKLFLYLFLISSNSLLAQLGSWNILTVRTDLSDRWSLTAEGQIRSLRFYNDFHYFEYKTGASFNINESFSAGVLVGHYRTYSEGGTFYEPIQSNELRTCFQITMKQTVHRFKFEHRYRIEQRFTSNGYRNRFRYRIGVNIPLNKETKKWNVIVWNEIFMTNTAPYFERDRFFAGFGINLTRQFSLQTGYVRQFDYNLTDEIGRDFFQIGFQFEIGGKNQTNKSSVQIGD